MAFKLKVDDEGKAVLSSAGQPIFLNDENEEFDFSHVQSDWGERLANTSAEAGKHRKGKADVKRQLDAFEALGKTPEELQEMVDTFADVDLSKLSKAEEVRAKIDAAVEGVKSQLTQAQKEYDKNLAERDGTIGKLQKDIHQLVISNAFATSPLFTDSKKTLMTPDVAEKVFGSNFRVENGQAVYYKDGFDEKGEPKGQPLYSRKDPGQMATFNEVVDIVWEDYAYRDRYTPPVGGGDHQGGERQGGGAGQQSSDLLTMADKAREEGRVQDSIALKRRAFNQQGGAPTKEAP